ncbi:hypothetical protein THOG11_90086 [Vibrio harveyi]|nr:hypothetical protein TH15OA1_320086 [Vibrio harveyi]CAH1563613.1 hypothetical protein THOD03_30086 [Vibrio harveyi]CAH1591141.1 hypothetical protein THOG11_90086 [Vibrio harveyi]CAK6714385.1 hypothetical protein HORM4_440040 [Vibrio harveyi]
MDIKPFQKLVVCHIPKALKRIANNGSHNSAHLIHFKSNSCP